MAGHVFRPLAPSLLQSILVEMTDSVQHSSFPSINNLGVTQDMLMERREKEKEGMGWTKKGYKRRNQLFYI